MTADGHQPDATGDQMADLLGRVSQGDGAAFRTIFEHFAPRLRAFVMAKGTAAQTAEDIVQETMVKIWRKAHQFDPARASAATWIFTVARNARIDVLRKVGRPEPDPDDPAFRPDDPDSPVDELARVQDVTQVQQAIAGLSAEQQEVLRLAYMEERAHPEIADILGIPLGTVKSRIRLAIKNMRSTLLESSGESL